MVRNAYHLRPSFRTIGATTSTAAPPDSATAARLRLVALRLARRVRQHAEAGVTPSQLSALSALDRRGSSRLGDLAAHEHIGKSTLTRVVAALTDAGYVERTPDADDARCSRVALSDEGRALLAASRERADAYLATRVAALDADEQARLAAALPVLESLLDDSR